jgi:hypothetical protein
MGKEKIVNGSIYGTSGGNRWFMAETIPNLIGFSY